MKKTHFCSLHIDLHKVVDLAGEMMASVKLFNAVEKRKYEDICSSF